MQPLILVSSRHYLWQYTTAGRPKGAILTNLTNGVAVDFDWMTNSVFWSDVAMNSAQIGRIAINGTLGTYQVHGKQSYYCKDSCITPLLYNPIQNGYLFLYKPPQGLMLRMT